MTAYQHAIRVVAEADDRRLAADVYRVFYGFDIGTLLDEVRLFVNGRVTIA